MSIILCRRTYCRWLDKDEGDQLTERTLDVLDPEGDPWTLTTLTSAEKDSGVAGPAAVVVYGSTGQSRLLQFGDDLNFEFKDGESQEFLVHVSKQDIFGSFDSYSNLSISCNISFSAVGLPYWTHLLFDRWRQRRWVTSIRSDSVWIHLSRRLTSSSGSWTRSGTHVFD